MEIYDSTQDTLDHIQRVRFYLQGVKENLQRRSEVHDASKLESPEKEAFDRATPKLKNLTYGSKEYKESLSDIKGAIKHHYSKNAHHIEFHKKGTSGMSLMDLIELSCDWKAAGERHSEGSMDKSLDINRKRYKMSDELYNILKNTAKELNWIKNGK